MPFGCGRIGAYTQKMNELMRELVEINSSAK